MYFSYNQAVAWITKHHEILKNFPDIIICPSLDALSTIGAKLQSTTIKLGAQNCSAHDLGAYTGEVAAQSLQEAGATYCIVGHSESRLHAHETDAMIAAKIHQLLSHGITPIVCIGETAQEREQHQTLGVLQRQLDAITPGLTNNIIIAYEPRWAIGTNRTPTDQELAEVYDFLQTWTITNSISATLLYGGSVSSTTIKKLASIDKIDGFLIGKASTDYNELQKILNMLY